MTSSSPMALRAGLLALCVCGASLDAVADDVRRTVGLQLKSRSWIANSAFDRDGYSALCNDAGIALVDERSPGVEAVAVVTYDEARGPGFSMFGVGAPAGFGTNIRFTLTLTSAGRSDIRFVLPASAETPAGEPKERFHQAAREAFAADPAFTLGCTAMAAALGSRAAALQLLPWAVLDTRASAIVDAIHFVPSTPLEKAYLVVAHRDLRQIEALGPERAEPLLLLFENSAQPRNGAGVFRAAVAGNAALLMSVLPLLASSGDERVPDTLVTFLADYGDFQNARDEQITPLLSAVVQTLGRVGSRFSLPMLDEWSKNSRILGGEAALAAAALRHRLEVE